MLDLSRNPNTRAATRFVDALADAGLEAVCVAPGSRSTPLVLAFAAEPRITLYRHLDERSAGFFALGLAKGSGRAVAVLCTSGTAAANFHPAVVEARYARVPLLVLTADRPPELRESGANQTIDQVKMYGDHVLWAVDVVLPSDEPSAVVDRYLNSLAARSVALAHGRPSGPVHLNFPFRKPLQPQPATRDDPAVANSTGDSLSTPAIVRGRLSADEGALRRLTNLVANEPRGIIVCGPESHRLDFAEPLRRLAEASGYPVLADALSGLRRGLLGPSSNLIGSCDALLQADPDALPEAHLVIRFGTVPTSAALNRYLSGLADATVVQISPDGTWADDAHITDLLIQADVGELCDQLAAALDQQTRRVTDEWLARFQLLEQTAWLAIEKALHDHPDSDAAAVWSLINSPPDGDSVVLAGNSLPVRLIDQLTKPAATPSWITGNRGASGIDGNVSAAFGLAASGSAPVTAILGDITFYHDMNGLMAQRLNALPGLTLVVLNNDGGGIFRRLPVSAYEEAVTDLFVMPHGLTYEQAAALYGLAYVRLAARDVAAYFDQSNGGAGHSTIIEIATDGRQDLDAQAHIATVIRRHLALLQQRETVIS